MTSHLKRWTGVSAGWVLSSEIVCSGEPTASDSKEGHNAAQVIARASRPRGVEDPRHAEKLHAREPGGPVVARRKWAGREEKAMSRKSFMHDGGESNSGIVPAKPPNQSEPSPAEVVEGRPLTKENTPKPNPYRTPSRTGGPSGLERVREAAKQDKKRKFTALLHHVSIDLLRESYHSLKKQAAPGVDGMTWQQYGEDLEARLSDLHGRIHRRAYRARPSRRVWIPKSDGRQRPLGVAALEDKIVQYAGKRTFWASATDSGLGAANKMHWTRCGWGSCARV